MDEARGKNTLKTGNEHTQDITDNISGVHKALTVLDKQVIRTSPFGENKSGETSYKRAERISAAIHLVTNHITLNEPLRTSARLGSVQLLDVLLELRTGFQTVESEKGQEALASIRRLISLVRMLSVAGYISASNASVIVEALDELGTLIVASQRSMLSEQLAITRSDLMPPIYANTTKPSRPIKRISRRNQTVTSAASTSDRARSSQIMDILKLGGALGIKDIVVHVPQYSEKMVQRELAELVRSGLAEKIGAKRWSKYRSVQ